MNFDTLIIYSLVSFFYIISPGPAIFLAIYNGATHGLKCVAASALGNIIGLMFLSILSISGLSAILLTSSTLFMLIKIIGAIYLVYLGIKQIRSTGRIHSNQNAGIGSDSKPLGSYFKQGLFVAATNPKPIIFFAALFPQFLSTDLAIMPQFTVMTAIFMLFSFVSLTCYGFLAHKAKGFLNNPDYAKWFHRISGSLFVGMGVSLTQLKSAN